MTNTLTEDQQSAARLADRGEDWQICDTIEAAQDLGIDGSGWLSVGYRFRQAMHDRDRFQRERDWWAERFGIPSPFGGRNVSR